MFETVLTADVVTVKVPDVAPPAILTELGTFPLALLELRLMLNPTVGAAPLRVTAPTTEAPPRVADGVIVIPVIAAGWTVNVAAFEVLPDTAVIVAESVEA